MNKRLLSMGIVASVAMLAMGIGGIGPTARAATNGSISGFVYFDTNMNGQRDAGEPPAAGRTVQLLDGEAAPLGPTTKSASDGSYRFDDLSPNGRYAVAVVRDAETPCINGGMAFFDGDQTSLQDLSVLPRGDHSITGTLVSDLNENGARDAGEPTLSGWQIHLYGYLGDIECDVVLATDSNGRFAFDGLPAATYDIVPDAVGPGLPDGTSWQLTFVDHPAGAPGDYPNSGWPDPSVNLTNSNRADGIVVGVHVLSGTSSVDAHIFHDSDLDGSKDAGEEPFDCCGIMLQRSTPLGFLPVEPDEPELAVGHYRWEGLPAGAYRIALLTWLPASTAPSDQDGRPVRTLSLQDDQAAVADFGFGPQPTPGPDDQPSPVEPSPTAVQPPLTTTAPPQAITSPNTGSGPLPAPSDTLPIAVALAFTGAGALTLTIRTLRRRS